MNHRIVIVTGGRAYANVQAVFDALAILSPDSVWHGGCPTGADAFADAWATNVGKPAWRWFPDWNKHGRAAGPVRNREMCEGGAACRDAEGPSRVQVVWFPGGRGTASCLGYAREFGLEILSGEALASAVER